jgi:hypothetical protein
MGKGGGVRIEKLGRAEIREFLDWIYERAVADHGRNLGRTANKAREHLRAVVSWACDQELIEAEVPEAQTATRRRRTTLSDEGRINALYSPVTE